MNGTDRPPSPGEAADPPSDIASRADHGPAPRPRGRFARWWWVAGLVIAVLVVVVLAPLASSDPDGLERVAADEGFVDRAENLVGGLLSDYAIPGIEDPTVSTILSGLLGLAIVVLAIVLLGRLLARRRA
jgi:hypothetical protein